MIRINLLGVERAKVKKKVAFQVGQKLTLGCSLILIVTALFVGWRFWSLNKQSANLDEENTLFDPSEVELHEAMRPLLARPHRRTAEARAVTGF